VVLLPFFVLPFLSCHRAEEPSPVLNHWGIEMYVRWETDSLGVVDYRDTLRYDVGEGKGYEIYFRDGGSGEIILNESPAFFKDFDFIYSYDEQSSRISIQGSSWLFAIYGSLYLEQNNAFFDVESLNDSTLVASWKNDIAESEPFYERFFLVSIQ
jgi:hypothetical protein